MARSLGLTRTRVTQLLDLLLLAPDIQAQVLALEAVDGVEPIGERALRDVANAGTWEEQRAAIQNRTTQPQSWGRQARVVAADLPPPAPHPTSPCLDESFRGAVVASALRTEL